MRTLLPLVSLLALACTEYKLDPKDSDAPPTPEVDETSLSLDPGSLDLGTLSPAQVGTGSFTLTATGGDVVVNQIALSGSFFVVEGTPAATVSEGSPVQVDIVFSSDTPGTYTDTLTVQSDADNGSTLTAALTALVVEPTWPDIEVRPLELTVEDGSSGVVNVHSVGTATLVVSGAEISPSSDAGFNILAMSDLSSLDPTESGTITIGYEGDGGVGTLTIASNDPDSPEVDVLLIGESSYDCTEVDADADGSNACDDCDDADPGRAPSFTEICDDGIDQDCDGADATSIVLGLLPGWGDGSTDTSLIWPEFTTTWGSYGSCAVRLVDIAEGFTLDTLGDSGATSLVITDPGGAPQQYTEAEMEAVREYAEGGYGGLIYTYLLTWDGWDHTEYYDNSVLAELVGIDPIAVSPTLAEGVSTSVDTLDAAHPLNDGLGASYSVTSYPYAQGNTTSWGAALLPGASVVAEATDGHMATIAYEGPTWRGVWFTGMADYDTGAPQAMYNAAIWTGAR